MRGGLQSCFVGVVASLCHLCQAPTTVSCRVCGKAVCPEHMEPGGMCHACMRKSHREGERDIQRRPRVGLR